MKFKESLLYNLLCLPVQEYKKGGVYRSLLLIPLYIVAVVVFIPVAFVVDSFMAFSSIGDGGNTKLFKHINS